MSEDIYFFGIQRNFCYSAHGSTLVGVIIWILSSPRLLTRNRTITMLFTSLDGVKTSYCLTVKHCFLFVFIMQYIGSITIFVWFFFLKNFNVYLRKMYVCIIQSTAHFSDHFLDSIPNILRQQRAIIANI